MVRTVAITRRIQHEVSRLRFLYRILFELATWLHCGRIELLWPCFVHISEPHWFDGGILVL
jgi:hypothetical protein